MALAESTNASPRLLKGIGLLAAIALMLTNAIGTGVFLKARVMICNVGTPGMVLLAYVVAGLFTLAGALIYAELSTLMPRSGGPYNYIGAAWGRVWGFLYGWMETFIDGGAGIAALAIVFVIFFNDLLGGSLSPGVSALLTVLTLAVVTLLNLVSVQTNGVIATVITGMKVAMLIGIAACAFIFGDGSWAHFSYSAAEGSCEGVPETARLGFAGFGAAIIAALWSYSGAATIIMVAEEVRDPSRTLPRSMITSVTTIIVLYVLINAAYFYALTPEMIASLPESHSVAGAVMARVLGAGASVFMAAGLMVSSFGSLHSSVLTMARVPFAMARDGLFPSLFARVSRRFHVPTYSVLFMGICAICFAMSGTFDMLTDMVVFSWLIFEILAVAAVFVLRKQATDVTSVYRAWGNSYLPWVYMLATAYLTINTLYALPGRSLAGLGLIGLGLPVFFYYTRRRSKPQRDDGLESDRSS